MNMQISDISLWGIAVTILMLCGIMGLFSLIDRKMMTRFFRVLIYMGLSLSVVALIIWGVFRLNGWWYGPLWAWLVVMGVASQGSLVAEAVFSSSDPFPVGGCGLWLRRDVPLGESSP